MAQALAEPGDVRHGFVYKESFSHDFSRITAMATNKDGDILLCDYNKKQVILVDSGGNFLTFLALDSNPYDVTVTSENSAFVTIPNERSVVQVDPDRLIICQKVYWEYPDVTPLSVLSFDDPIDGRAYCTLGNVYDGNQSTKAVTFQNNQLSSCKRETNEKGTIRERYVVPDMCAMSALKMHALSKIDVMERNVYCCVGGQDYVVVCTTQACSFQMLLGYEAKHVKIPSLKVPTDLCSDDNCHVYVSGQKSDTIHRLTDEGKVVDIPLSRHHGINKPVAICFSRDFSKFYVANEFGKSVLVFDVV